MKIFALCSCHILFTAATFSLSLALGDKPSGAAAVKNGINSSKKEKDVVPRSSSPPLIVSTWAHTDDFRAAPQRAWDALDAWKAGDHTDEQTRSNRRLNALVEGLSECERRQCDRTVGFGGSPDEHGETTLDALVMDGPGHRSGAVGALRRVKSAARVAWAVYNRTEHSLLVGESATQFALAMGFSEESLATEESRSVHEQWLKSAHCQPNFWKNVVPDPRTQCGPYHPKNNNMEEHGNNSANFSSRPSSPFQPPFVNRGPEYNIIVSSESEYNNNEGEEDSRRCSAEHRDTIGMVVVDEWGEVAVGTSSNGACHKVPGRVGDAPLVGAGAYVDQRAGAAAVATGDGDQMLRFVPTFLAVELMRSGAVPGPREAAREAIARILAHYPLFSGAVVAVDGRRRVHGAACAGWTRGFTYSVVDGGDTTMATGNGTAGVSVHVETVQCEGGGHQQEQ